MSQTLASAAARAARAPAPSGGPRPASTPGTRPSPRRPLRVVQAPPTAGSPLGFALICASLLGAGLIALLLLNTAVAQDSFGLQRLQANTKALADQKQALIQSNDLSAAPAQLSAKAWALGLVPASGTAFVQLPSGKVMGVANPAPRVKPPTVITSTNGNNSTKRTSIGTATTSTAATQRAVSPGASPGTAPAAPVDANARTGTAPGLAPAAPKGGTAGTTTKTGQQTTTGNQQGAPATTTR